ncbi:MAG TPA: F0F1 ATP synthase subunit B [Dehalococcoidia bacterium]|jgi:F-type H+-transporting ATPase subunit b|nr:F0F1 ATP synthase subunit B [Dehalococcoidia bacterium]
MGAIGINLPLLVAFIINFVILFALLGLVLYKPAMKMLDERSKKIKESMAQAEATKAEYARAEEEVKKLISKAREDGQALVSQATQIGERLKEEAKDGARKEAQVIVDRTRAELEEERDRIIDDLRREFVDISISAAEKVIKETLDKERHRRLIEETLKESSTFREN